MIIEIRIRAFSGCWPLNVMGDPDIIPWSFKKAIIEPEKVIAPTAATVFNSIGMYAGCAALFSIPAGAVITTCTKER